MFGSEVNAFQKVAERFQIPLNLVRTTISFTVSMAREPATAEDAPVAVASSPAGSKASIEDMKEEDWKARKPFSDRTKKA